MNTYPGILYVEDDALSRMVLEIIVREKMGLLNLVIFSDSENFKKRIDEIPFVPDVILLDIHVRPFSGFEMLDMLRQHPIFQAKPVVALTASVMNEELDRLKESGFDGVIAKPLNDQTFPFTLQRILQGEQVWSIL